MKRRSLLTFVDRDIRLRRPTDGDRNRCDQVGHQGFVLVDAKTDEVVGIVNELGLYDRDGNHFED